MKTNRKVFLLAFLAIVLVLTSTSCSDPGRETKAEVRVIGTAKANNTRAVASTSFGSGEVFIDGNKITDQLKPVPASDEEQQTMTSSNDQIFEADVPVSGETVSYRVDPHPGFVFDEWKIVNRNAIRSAYPDAWWDVLKEIWIATRGDDETITIKPEYIKFIRPSFDRGFKVASEKSFAESLSEYMSDLHFRQYDEDELTIKFTKGDFELDLSSFEPYSLRDDELELELKIIGGYSDDIWNVLDGAKTTITGIKLPTSKGFEEIELELEFRNIHFSELDYSDFASNGDTEFEIDFRNCAVGTLKNARGIINGMVVENIDSSAQKIMVINSDAPYMADAVYYHSIIRGENIGQINGENNIIVAEGSDGTHSNVYIADFGSDYKNEAFEEQIVKAAPLPEDMEGLDDDILEEDIEGRERYLLDDDDKWYGNRNIYVSYGPYEYQWFDD